MKASRGTALSLLTVLVVSSFAGLFVVAPAATITPAYAQTPTVLNLGLTRFATFPSLNPFTPINTHPVVAEMYLECNYKTDFPDPHPMKLALCNSWKETGNYTTFTMNLRPGLKWSDGSPLTATDFAYSLYLYNYTHKFTPPIHSIQEINSTAVSATMNEYTPNFMWSITDAYIVPKEIFGTIPLASLQNYTNFGPIVGAGPFVISSYVRGTNPLVMTANPYYFQGRPYYDQLIIHMFSGSFAAYSAALLAGQLDALWVTGTAQAVAPFRNLNGYSITSWPLADAMDRVAPNTAIYPFSSTAFRQGLAYATNRTALAETIYGPGYSLVNYGLYPSGTGYPDYNYNIATADQLFTQAGLVLNNGQWFYANGTRVSITIAYPSTDPDSGNIATVLTSQWQAAGFEVTPSSQDAVSLYSALGAQKFSVAVYLAFSAVDLTNCCGFMDGNPGSNYLYTNENGTYLDQTLPGLYQKWYTTPSLSPQQNAVSQQIGAIVAHYVPIIPMFQLSSFEPYNSQIWWGEQQYYTGLFDQQIVGQPIFFQTTLYYARPLSLVNGTGATETCGFTCTTPGGTTTSSTASSTTQSSTTSSTPTGSTTSSTAASSTSSTSSTTAESGGTDYTLIVIVAVLVIIVVGAAVVLMRRRPPAAPAPAAPAPTNP